MFRKPPQEWEQPRTTKLWWKRNKNGIIGFLTGGALVFTASTIATIALYKPPPPPVKHPPALHPITLQEANTYEAAWNAIKHSKVYNLQIVTHIDNNIPVTIVSAYDTTGEGYGTIQAGSAAASTMLHKHVIYISAGADFWKAINITYTGELPEWVVASHKLFNSALYPNLFTWANKAKSSPDMQDLGRVFKVGDVNVLLTDDESGVAQLEDSKTVITINDPANIKPIAPITQHNVAVWKSVGIIRTDSKGQSEIGALAPPTNSAPKNSLPTKSK